MYSNAIGCAIVLVIPIIALVGCFEYYGSFNYRITIIVDTPAGAKVGSAVRHVAMGSFDAMDTSGVWSKVKGDAVAVNLGEGRWLIAPLKARFDTNGIDVFGVIAAEGDKRKFNRYSPSSGAFWTWVRKLKYEHPYRISKLTCDNAYPTDANLNTGKFDQNRPTCPTLVTFDDVREPETVRIVDPNDLENVFGPGFKLRAINVQMTDESPTRSIQAVLPWLNPAMQDREICSYQLPIDVPPSCAAFDGKDFARDD